MTYVRLEICGINRYDIEAITPNVATQKWRTESKYTIVDALRDRQ